MEIIQELIQFRNKYPRLYDLAEKEYMEANEDVAVNPHRHIVIEELTSYHAVRFMKLLDEYILDERERFDD